MKKKKRCKSKELKKNIFDRFDFKIKEAVSFQKIDGFEVNFTRKDVLHLIQLFHATQFYAVKFSMPVFYKVTKSITRKETPLKKGS